MHFRNIEVQCIIFCTKPVFYSEIYQGSEQFQNMGDSLRGKFFPLSCGFIFKFLPEHVDFLCGKGKGRFGVKRFQILITMFN